MSFQSLSGLQYLQAEIACKADKAFEKATWDERLAHFETLDLNAEITYKKASNPIGLRAAAHALRDQQTQTESGYLISLDACSSGLQILSLLVSCPKSFSLCGGNSAQCVDSYVSIYDSMNLHGSLTRKEVKAAIMTSLYGSVAMPEQTFGNNVDLFYETMETMAPGAWDLNLGLQELWDKVKGSVYSWVMPDNFHACIETKTKITKEFHFNGASYDLPQKIDGRPDFHKGLGPNLIHSVDGLVVREMYRRCMFKADTIMRVIDAITGEAYGNVFNEEVSTLWNHYLNTGFLSVRILDELTEDNIGLVDPVVIAKLIQTLPEKAFDVVSVHDCFRCHPNYGDDLRRQYNNIMADVNDATGLLSQMCSQVANETMKAKKLGTIPRDTILQSNYMLA
jgi:hypothetical protein